MSLVKLFDIYILSSPDCARLEVTAAAELLTIGRAIIVVDGMNAADGVKLPVNVGSASDVAVVVSSDLTKKLSISRVSLRTSGSPDGRAVLIVKLAVQSCVSMGK